MPVLEQTKGAGLFVPSDNGEPFRADVTVALRQAALLGAAASDEEAYARPMARSKGES